MVADFDNFSHGMGKVVANQGGGPPPGYRRSVYVLGACHKESMKIYNKDQYFHLSLQVKEVARQEIATQSITVDVRRIGEFYEIRDKGGVLGKINARVFFFVDDESHSIVVLGTIKKENENQTPPYIVTLMTRRMREYLKMHALGRAEGDSQRRERT